MTKEILKGDCLELMKSIPDKTIDMILCDLPYGSTKNKWDFRISLSDLWLEYERIIKYNGCIALFAQTPFDKILGASNIELLKYEYIWIKNRPTGHLNSRFAPLKSHENILIFSKASAGFVKDKGKGMSFYPQFSKGKPYTAKGKTKSTNYDFKYTKEVITVNNGDYYPTSILEYNTETGYHPTQKPIALFEYLIKTYTNENDLVLDNCAGSGTTAIACLKANRQFIVMEKELKYFEIINKRVEDFNNAKISEIQF